MIQPHIIFWEITQSCNLRCPYCRRARDTQVRFSLADARRVIDALSEHCRPLLVFSGGEPLLHPELADIVDYASSRSLGQVALATNATLVDPLLAKKIRAMNFHRVSVGLDAASADVNDALRGKGAFSKIVKGIYCLRAEGVDLQVNMTLTRVNAGEVEALHNFCACLGVKAMHIFVFVPVGCGLQVPADERLTAREYETFLEGVADMSRGSDIEVRVTCGPHYYRILAQKGYPAPPRFSRGCLAGSRVCFISSLGEVYPCGYLPVSAGNILREPFGKIWNESRVLQELRRVENLKGRCGRCEYTDLCGGCRARAWADFDDYLEEEPDCVYQPLIKKS